MAYDGIHNITRKTQTAFLALSNGSTTPNVALTYDYAYAYAGGRPHAASQAGNHAFLYDLDGNQAGWNATDSYQNRRMVWDEDDRLQSVTGNNGQPTTFKYDGDTNRVVKKGAGGETLYINPWYVAALGRNSKQVFAGGTRIVTKLEISPTGEGYGPGAKNLKEVAQYFYHQDHLGSTGFVTDATGEVYQHLEYFPFGETWVDEVSDDLRVPYRFTGQEFDQETRLYYYGARYYDPRTSVWQSADPALGRYLNSTRRSAEPRHGSLYGYANNSPLIMLDPNGAEAIVLSGQPGPMTVDNHFLNNGLARAQALAKQGNNTTWIVYTGDNTGTWGEYAYSNTRITEYRKLAEASNIKFVAFDNVDDIVKYINNKNGDDRQGDLVTDFAYVGHGLPGRMAIAYPWEDAFDLDVSKLSPSAFASGSRINLRASCNQATPKTLNGKDSVLERFGGLVDKKSVLMGVRGSVDFGSPEADTDEQLIAGGRQRSNPGSSWFSRHIWPEKSMEIRQFGTKPDDTK